MQALRMWEWGLATAALVLLLWVLAPANLPVLVYKLSLVTLAAVVGYWLDRRLFRGASWDRYTGANPTLAAAAMMRRALIVSAAILGVTMGL